MNFTASSAKCCGYNVVRNRSQKLAEDELVQFEETFIDREFLQI